MALAKLSIDITAKLAEFERDMGKAAGAADKAAGEIRKQFEGLRDSAAQFTVGLAAGIAGALAGGALAQWTSVAVDAADELARLSDQTGISVEQLSAWGAVARRNGQDVNDLAELTTELSLRLAEIDKDSEGAGLALKQLGLDYKQLAAMPADKAFEAVAKAVANTEDSGRKTALVMAAMGDEAQKYITTLNTIGAAGEMQALVTDRQAEEARRYKDALANLTAEGDVWLQSVVGGIVPALAEAARAMLNVMSGTDGMTAEARRLAQDGTITEWARAGIRALTYLADAGSVIVRAFKIVGQTIGADLAIAGEAFTSLGAAAQQALSGDFAGAVETARGGIARVKSISADASATLDKLWSEPTLGAAIRSSIEDEKKYGAVVSGYAKTLKTSVANRSLVKADDSKAKAAAAATKKAADEAARLAKQAEAEYEKLITSIRTKTDAERAELNGTAATTEAGKMALEVMSQLRDGRLKLTDAQKQTVTGYLEELLTTERLLTAKREQIEIDAQAAANTGAVRDAIADRINALTEQTKAERLSAEEIGLSARALDDLRASRQLDAAGALERRAAIAAEQEGGASIAALYRDQAAALRELVGAQQSTRNKAEAARKDPVAGARAGLEAYRLQLSDTASDVQSAFGSIAGGIEGAMASAFSGSADGAKQLFATIKAEAIKLLVIKPILQQLTGSGGGNVLGSLVSAAGAMFGGGVGNAGAGDYSAQGLAAAFGRAGGGTVSPGSLHRVNERGPELVSTGGKDYLMMGGSGGFVTPITPAAPAGSGRGPVSITYAPQIQIDSRADRAQVAQDMAAVNRRGQEEMMQMLRERGIA